MRIHFEDGIGVRLRAALLEHLVEIINGAGLIVGLPVHDLFGGGKQHATLVVESKVGTVGLLQRVERFPAGGGVHVLFNHWKTIVQPLYLIVYQDIPLCVGGHGLVNQRDGQFGFPISYHPDAALVEHVVEGRAQVAGFGDRFEQ